MDVRFKILRAAGEGESLALAAKLGDLLWTGTATVRALEAMYAITTADRMERTCMVDCLLANVKLNE